MVVEPGVTPVTTPVEELTVAAAGLLLLHVPPVVVQARVVVDPTDTLVVPVMAATVGTGFTVTTAVAPVVIVLQGEGSTRRTQ